MRREDDEAPVVAYPNGEAAAARPGPLVLGARDTDALGRPEQAVAKEDVVPPVRVAAAVEQGCRLGCEDDVAPVRRDRRLVAAAVRLGAERRDAHDLRRPRLPVPHEDVSEGVPVARHEVARV